MFIFNGNLGDPRGLASLMSVLSVVFFALSFVCYGLFEPKMWKLLALIGSVTGFLSLLWFYLFGRRHQR